MEKVLEVLSPFDNSKIDEIPLAEKEDIYNALQIAHSLHNNRNTWLKPWQRIQLLEKVVDLMTQRKERLIEIATLEGGKPIIDTNIEVERAIIGVKIAIQQIAALSGRQVPMGQTESSINRLSFSIREPIGVVVSISAFNHPVNLIIHQVITAIAVGAPVIIKPALTTPLSCIEIVNIIYDAGLPKEWCQIIICNNENAEILATDSRVSYLSFIGSAKVGWYLRSKLALGTRCALEHGGIAPVFIEKDAQIKQLIPLITKGGYYHAGQVCVSVQKVMVHESIIDEFLSGFITSVEKLIVGNPLDKKTDVGPIISIHEINRIEKWVNEAISQGAKLITGGKKISDKCFQPTILLNPPKDALVSTNEIFGPVVCVYSYSSLKEEIKKANNLPFAFQASVFTTNIDTAMSVISDINAATVLINDHTAFRVDWMPFGGRNLSGIGVGGIPYTMKEMTNEKLIIVKSAEL